MLNKYQIIGVLAVVLAAVVLVRAGSVGIGDNVKQFNKRTDNNSEMTMEEATRTCNQSFVIKMDYLEELNKTGSFPDESDVVPMCFMKCYLEKMGIMSDEGDINEEKALQMMPDSTKDMLADCADEMEKGSDICEKAYYISRCVTTRILVDGRSKD